jgi:hypothetical protein
MSTLKYNFLFKIHITPFRKFLNLKCKNLVPKANLKQGSTLSVFGFNAYIVKLV